MIKIPRTQDHFKMVDKYPCKDNTYPCVVCGRPCPKPKYMLWCHNGGSDAVTEEEGTKLNAEGREGADLGNQPIGTDCLKKHPELKPYVWKIVKELKG